MTQILRRHPRKWMRRAALLCCLVVHPLHAHQGLAADIARVSARLWQDPADVSALVERAVLYRRQGELALALADLHWAATFAPDDVAVVQERGLVLARMGDHVAALRDLERVALRDDVPKDVRVALATIHEAQGHLVEAWVQYDEALRVHPDPELFLARGRIDEQLRRWEVAASGYREGLSALDGAVVLRLALLRVLKVTCGHQEAIALIDDAMAASQVKADWALMRADFREQAGDGRGARRDRENALRESNELLQRGRTALRLLTRARALAALGRTSEARKDAQAALELAPRLDDATSLLATLQHRP
ncbi:MAG: hypothetical protein AB2A00_07855 [Myxococcota bacterium]